MRKRQFIKRLLAKRDEWEALINQVGFARLNTLPGVCGQWSVKDIVAHIMSYEQYIADRIAEIGHGEAYAPAQNQSQLDTFLARFGYPDFGSPLLNDDGPNAWIVEKYRNVPMEEVVAQEMNAFHAIVHSLEALSEGQILEHNLFERVAENSYEHYYEHARDIKRWLITVKP
jgi:hypothetical protein